MSDHPTRSRGITMTDLLVEALAGVLDRPTRAAMTAMGTILGVGSLIAVLGLTASAGHQISRTFTLAAATQIQVSETGDADLTTSGLAGAILTGSAFPDDADARVRRISGVRSAGITWAVGGISTVTGSPAMDAPTLGVDVSVVAASTGYLDACGVELAEGTLYSQVHEEHALPVALLGSRAAEALGVATVATHPVVTIDGVPVTVIGIISGASRRADLATAVLVSPALVGKEWPEPGAVATMLVVTQPGAAQAVAAQIPVALRPDAPSLIVVTPPPHPHELRENVETQVSDLLLLLAGVSLLVGAFGIANTSTMSVMERTSEIGLRRALGAQRRTIAAQFLIEAMTLGAVGGVLGSSLGVIVVLAVTIAQQWTAVIDPLYLAAGPVLGALVGAAAGVYPARRASAIEPVRALRS